MLPERTGFPTERARRVRLAPGMRAGRAIAVLATLVATAGGADAHAAPFAPFARTDGTTFTVTSAADTDDGTCDAECTLREAIGASNAVAGPDANTIAFDIDPDGPATITLSSSLPAITRPVLIDGSTQPGIDDGTPRIEVTTTAGLDRLLDFEAGAGSTVRDLSLHGTATRACTSAARRRASSSSSASSAPPATARARATT